MGLEGDSDDDDDDDDEEEDAVDAAYDVIALLLIAPLDMLLVGGCVLLCVRCVCVSVRDVAHLCARALDWSYLFDGWMRIKSQAIN